MTTIAAVICVAGTCVLTPVSVHDGDTIRYGQTSVRILNIDAPEVTRCPAIPPKRRRTCAPCPDEVAWGYRARDGLAAMLSGKTVRVTYDGVDKYRRRLALLEVDGHDVGAMMIAAGLAQPWIGRKAEWCR
jgi:micrococcal nuclease